MPHEKRIAKREQRSRHTDNKLPNVLKGFSRRRLFGVFAPTLFFERKSLVLGVDFVPLLIDARTSSDLHGLSIVSVAKFWRAREIKGMTGSVRAG
jgi:hypothetical protein